MRPWSLLLVASLVFACAGVLPAPALASTAPDGGWFGPPEAARTGSRIAIESIAEAPQIHGVANGIQSAEPPRPRRGHLLIWDQLVVVGALGAVDGIARGRCEGKSFDPGPILGWTVVWSLLSVLSERDNPYETRHPPVPSHNLGILRKGTGWRGPVEVRMLDGTTLSGTLIGIADDSILVRNRQGRRTLAHADVLEIDKQGDPPWDGLARGAVGGALCGLLASTECDRTRDDSLELAVMGGAIVGVTGLALDILHDGRFTLFREQLATSPRSLRITPAMSSGSVGVRLSMHF